MEVGWTGSVASGLLLGKQPCENWQENRVGKGIKRRCQSDSDVKIHCKAKGIKINQYNIGIHRQLAEQNRNQIQCKYEKLVCDKGGIQNNEKRMDYSLINIESTG